MFTITSVVTDASDKRLLLLRSDMAKIFNTDLFTDIKVIDEISQEIIKCHKLVLFSRCPVIKDLVIDTIHGAEVRLSVPGSRSLLPACLKFLYCDTLTKEDLRSTEALELMIWTKRKDCFVDANLVQLMRNQCFQIVQQEQDYDMILKLLEVSDEKLVPEVKWFCLKLIWETLHAIEKKKQGRPHLHPNVQHNEGSLLTH